MGDNIEAAVKQQLGFTGTDTVKNHQNEGVNDAASTSDTQQQQQQEAAESHDAEAFPYPKEYQYVAPSDDSKEQEHADDSGSESESSFPYPKEYMAPSKTTATDEQEDDDTMDTDSDTASPPVTADEQASTSTSGSTGFISSGKQCTVPKYL